MKRIVSVVLVLMMIPACAYGVERNIDPERVFTALMDENQSYAIPFEDITSFGAPRTDASAEDYEDIWVAVLYHNGESIHSALKEMYSYVISLEGDEATIVRIGSSKVDRYTNKVTYHDDGSISLQQDSESECYNMYLYDSDNLIGDGLQEGGRFVFRRSTKALISLIVVQKLKGMDAEQMAQVGALLNGSNQSEVNLDPTALKEMIGMDEADMARLEAMDLDQVIEMIVSMNSIEVLWLLLTDEQIREYREAAGILADMISAMSEEEFEKLMTDAQKLASANEGIEMDSFGYMLEMGASLLVKLDSMPVDEQAEVLTGMNGIVSDLHDLSEEEMKAVAVETAKLVENLFGLDEETLRKTESELLKIYRFIASRNAEQLQMITESVRDITETFENLSVEEKAQLLNAFNMIVKVVNELGEADAKAVQSALSDIDSGNMELFLTMF
ncbi:MAG: hypothetical protein U0L09_03735 [Christensenellales bacterium]|nr:hypothetical protein [Christensenellales bacterium]